MKLNNKYKETINYCNAKGIPLPLLRINNKPTLTGTMVVLSFSTCLFGQVGKVTSFLGPVDLKEAIYLFGVCLTAYLGRRMQDSKQKVEENEEENKT